MSSNTASTSYKTPYFGYELAWFNESNPAQKSYPIRLSQCGLSVTINQLQALPPYMQQFQQFLIQIPIDDGSTDGVIETTSPLISSPGVTTSVSKGTNWTNSVQSNGLDDNPPSILSIQVISPYQNADPQLQGVTLKVNIPGIVVNDTAGTASFTVTEIYKASNYNRINTLPVVKFSDISNNIYVPMQVQAWIKNAHSVETPTIVQDPPQYSNLNAYSPDVMPDPGDVQKRAIEADGEGIYLHWVIPRGFRHGYKQMPQTRGVPAQDAINVYTLSPKTVVDPKDRNGTAINNIINVSQASIGWSPSYTTTDGVYYNNFTLDQVYAVVGVVVKIPPGSARTQSLWLNSGITANFGYPGEKFTITDTTSVSVTFMLKKPLASSDLSIAYQTATLQPPVIYQVTFLVAQETLPVPRDSYKLTPTSVVDPNSTSDSSILNLIDRDISTAWNPSYASSVYYNNLTLDQGYTIVGFTVYGLSNGTSNLSSISIASGAMTNLNTASETFIIRSVTTGVFSFGLTKPLATNLVSLAYQVNDNQAPTLVEVAFQVLNPTMYPQVPNRWLVTRRMMLGNSTVSGGSQGSTDLSTSWVVESDTMIDTTKVIPSNDVGCATFCDVEDVTIKGGGTGTGKAVNIGQKIPLLSWKETNPSRVNLRIANSGNILFADYQPHCQNVFSIFDPVGNEINALNLGAVTISYCVIGWYSVQDDDPLYKACQQTVNPVSEVSNMFLDLQTSTLSSDSCFYLQGTVYDIPWIPNQKYPSIHQISSQGGYDNIQCSIGINSADAFAALLDANGIDPSFKTVFEGFIHGQLDKMTYPDQAEKAIDEIYATGFNSTSGGLIWEIVAVQAGKSTDSNPQLTASQLDVLKALQSDQFQADQLSRELEFSQAELFSLWWKYRFIYTHGGNPGTYSQDPSIKTCRQTVIDLKLALLVQQLRTQNDINNLSTLGVIMNNQNTGLSLKPTQAQRFKIQNDPAVVITGLGSSWPSSYFDPVLCRSQNEIVLRFERIRRSTIDVNSLNGIIGFDPLLKGNLANLPSRVSQALQILLTEFGLIDPYNIQKVQQLGTMDPIILKTGIGYYKYDQNLAPVTTTPMYGTEPWNTQPWFPLFILWRIKWAQVPFKNWTFGDVVSEAGRAGYSLNPGVSLQQKTFQSLRGRSVILPHVKFNCKSQIEDLARKDPNFNKALVPALTSMIDSWDMLSQPLDGFRDQLTTRSRGLHTTPISQLQNSSLTSAEMSDIQLMGQQYQRVPILESHIAAPFQSVAHGQFYFDEIQIVDRFGQAIILTDTNRSNNFTLAKSPLLTPSYSVIQEPRISGMIQVPPRILQESRLNLDWASATSGDTLTQLDLDQNPICGWVIVNYLDNGVQLYDVDGSPVGELRLTSNQISTWTPLKPQGPNNGYMTLLLNQLRNGTALVSFLNLLGVAFNNIQPPPVSSNYLRTLSGRPLALTRIKLGLQLAQPAYQSYNAEGILSETDTILGQYRFDLRLGEASLMQDGLIGYFKDEEIQSSRFGPCYSVYSDQLDQPDPGSFRPVTGNDIQLQPFSRRPSSKEISTTLIMDPFNQIHAFTQILPVTRFQLPGKLVEQVLNKLQGFYRAGPLIVPDQLGAKSIKISKPPKGQWSWWTPITANPPTFSKLDIDKIDSVPRLEPSPYTAVHGFLVNTTSSPTIQSNDPSSLSVRMYTGTTSTTDSQGQVWIPDGYYNAGVIRSTSNNITNTSNPILYQSERTANAFTYTFPVFNGHYIVILKFAEIAVNKIGQRIFSVSINNTPVITNLDLVDQVGAFAAYDQSFPVIVASNQIVIQFTTNSSSPNNAKISGLVISPIRNSITRVRCGGNQVTDHSNQIWFIDNGLYSSNTGTYSTGDNITNTSDSSLYQFERYGSSMTYTWMVPNGKYSVTLKFAEIAFTGTGQRIFSVSINGTAVITNLDLVAQVGAFVAYDTTFPVTAVDNQILIQFTATVNNAKISAIEIQSS